MVIISKLITSLLCLKKTTAVQTSNLPEIKVVKLNEHLLDRIIRGFLRACPPLSAQLDVCEIWKAILGDKDSRFWDTKGKTLVGAPVCFKITTNHNKQWLIALTQSCEKEYKKYLSPYERQKILLFLGQTAYTGTAEVDNIMAKIVKKQLQQISQNREEMMKKNHKWEWVIIPYENGQLDYTNSNFRRGDYPYYGKNRWFASDNAKKYDGLSDCILTPELIEELQARWLIINRDPQYSNQIMGRICIRGVPLDYNNCRMEGKMFWGKYFNPKDSSSILGKIEDRILVKDPGVIPWEADMNQVWTDIYGHSYHDRDPEIRFLDSIHKVPVLVDHKGASNNLQNRLVSRSRNN